MSGTTSRLPSAFLGVLSAIAVFLLGCLGAGLRVNVSGSIPVGVYRLAGEADHLKRGDLVLACLPAGVGELAHARGYVPRGGECSNSLAPIGKMVMALPGDTVTVAPTGIIVNGVAVPNSKPLRKDRAHRLLPVFAQGVYVVTADSLWLVGSSPGSFDSRYFGAVPIAAIVSRVRRL